MISEEFAVLMNILIFLLVKPLQEKNYNGLALILKMLPGYLFQIWELVGFTSIAVLNSLRKQLAVHWYNIKIVPDNTVLLSFKLTVGRIAITDGEMSTNEAIAHFKTDKKEINEYLYCFLKCFNYRTMGSTSSIATAVNSKIIKSMPFVVPTDDELTEFHSIAAPMFANIKINQNECKNLAVLRDTLLPKLISGELDVSALDI